MAEAAGLLIDANVTEAELASFFRRKVLHEESRKTVGHVLSQWLERGDLHGNVTIVHHDPDRNRLFLAWVLNHYAAEAIAPIWPILDVLSKCMDARAGAEGAIVSTLPACLETVRITDGKVSREPPGSAIPMPTMNALAERFWSFASKGQFPDAAGSMRRRNYQCKPFKRAWKTYLQWRDEQERPARIAAATQAQPYNLFGQFYCWDGIVVHRDIYTKRDLVLPQADPLTLRFEGGYYADKSHVWHRQLAKNSPPERIPHGSYTVNNPDAIWEYCIVAGADGGSFTWLYDRHDTTFWADKDRVYANSADGLAPLADVKASEFREYGRGFGTDGKSIFCSVKKLPLNAQQLRTDGFFIWDDAKVFEGDTELPLRGSGFRILGKKYIPGTPWHRYRLTDGVKIIIWESSGIALPDDPNF